MIRYILIAFVATFFINCTPKIQHVADVTDNTYRIDEKYRDEDSAVETMIKPYRKDLEATMDKVLGTCEEQILKSKPNSPLLNFMADALLAKSNEHFDNRVDVAVQNYGGIRVNSLPQGNITVGHIYELMPFENTLVILKVNGQVLKDLFDRIADYGGWPVSDGVKFRINKEKEAADITIRGEPLEIDREYYLALPDYIANGGDKIDHFKESERTDTGILIRDLLIEYVKDNKGIPINNEIRIIDEQ